MRCDWISYWMCSNFTKFVVEIQYENTKFTDIAEKIIEPELKYNLPEGCNS